MTQYSEIMARTIQCQWGEEFSKHRAHITEALHADDVFEWNPKSSLNPVFAPSLTNLDVDINAGWMILDPEGHGTFESETGTRILVFIVNPTQRGNRHRAPARGVTPSPEEQEEWAYAALGERWFDYGYRVATSRALVRSRPMRFVVFLDINSSPRLAPGDFDWSFASGGDPAVRQKLRPRNPSRDLEQILIKVGDVIPVAHESDGNQPVQRRLPRMVE